jgi:hypothetical protein
VGSSGCALVGHTGFVGTSLRRQTDFDGYFNRANAEELRGRSFDLLVCCAAPAVKWLANRQPADDWSNLSALMGILGACSAQRFALISTVDVYPNPAGVDETTAIDPEANHAYGRHRFLLERFVAERFPSPSVIRLPALFGPGLKKNLIFDLLTARDDQFTHPRSTFQFYDLDLLWADVTKVLEAGISLVNLASEPIPAEVVASSVFGVGLCDVHEDIPRVAYDVRSRYSRAWGRGDGYLYGKGDVLDRMRAFVARERGAR